MFSLCSRYHNDGIYIIDVSQSVEHDHPHALEFLRKDCTNISGIQGVKRSPCFILQDLRLICVTHVSQNFSERTASV